VELAGVVARDGSLQALRALHSPGPELTQAAVEAARSWRFEPATLNGQPVAISITIAFDFELEGANP
jgi:protein TonB